MRLGTEWEICKFISSLLLFYTQMYTNPLEPGGLAKPIVWSGLVSFLSSTLNAPTEASATFHGKSIEN